MSKTTETTAPPPLKAIARHLEAIADANPTTTWDGARIMDLTSPGHTLTPEAVQAAWHTLKADSNDGHVTDDTEAKVLDAFLISVLWAEAPTAAALAAEAINTTHPTDWFAAAEEYGVDDDKTSDTAGTTSDDPVVFADGSSMTYTAGRWEEDTRR